MTARLRFHGDLADLARGEERDVPVADRRSVKDAIESCGVPHTEVALVVRDGESLGFDARLDEDDEVAVHPPATAPHDVTSQVAPPPRGPRFVLDVHLGRLAERLRLLGFDSAYDNAADDADLAEVADAEQRWLLTCDRGLLMRNRVTHGYLVRSRDPDEQVDEVVARFGLADRVSPHTRCARCNGTLRAVTKEEIAHRLEPGTRRDHDEFVRCDGCGQLYWRGSHADAIDRLVARARSAGRRSS